MHGRLSEALTPISDSALPAPALESKTVRAPKKLGSAEKGIGLPFPNDSWIRTLPPHLELKLKKNDDSFLLTIREAFKQLHDHLKPLMTDTFRNQSGAHKCLAGRVDKMTEWVKKDLVKPNEKNKKNKESKKEPPKKIDMRIPYRDLIVNIHNYTKFFETYIPEYFAEELSSADPLLQTLRKLLNFAKDGNVIDDGLEKHFGTCVIAAPDDKAKSFCSSVTIRLDEYFFPGQRFSDLGFDTITKTLFSHFTKAPYAKFAQTLITRTPTKEDHDVLLFEETKEAKECATLFMTHLFDEERMKQFKKARFIDSNPCITFVTTSIQGKPVCFVGISGANFVTREAMPVLTEIQNLLNNTRKASADYLFHLVDYASHDLFHLFTVGAHILVNKLKKSLPKENNLHKPCAEMFLIPALAKSHTEFKSEFKITGGINCRVSKDLIVDPKRSITIKNEKDESSVKLLDLCNVCQFREPIYRAILDYDDEPLSPTDEKSENFFKEHKFEKSKATLASVPVSETAPLPPFAVTSAFITPVAPASGFVALTPAPLSFTIAPHLPLKRSKTSSPKIIPDGFLMETDIDPSRALPLAATQSAPARLSTARDTLFACSREVTDSKTTILTKDSFKVI